MTDTLVKADAWTVYHLGNTGAWGATVQLPERRNGFDSVSRYDFDDRSEAIDWCLDLLTMSRQLTESERDGEACRSKAA